MNNAVWIALNLATFPLPNGDAVTINPEDVVSLATPHRGFDPKVKCVVNMVDGKHISVGIDCAAVKERLTK